jgi:hypothetical protein
MNDVESVRSGQRVEHVVAGEPGIVFADKLFANFGMVWHDGALSVMNMPHLTVFEPTRFCGLNHLSRDAEESGRQDQMHSVR